jgi:transposase
VIDKNVAAVFRCSISGQASDRWLEVPAWMFDREVGASCGAGVVNLVKLARAVFDERDPQHMLPEMAQVAMATLVRRLLELEDELRKLDKVLHEWHRQNEASRRVAAVPGIGVITATAIVATVSDPGQFRSGRQFAAWLGLVPKQNSSGERQRLGGISKLFRWGIRLCPTS